jgi:hypothetical protein
MISDIDLILIIIVIILLLVDKSQKKNITNTNINPTTYNLNNSGNSNNYNIFNNTPSTPSLSFGGHLSTQSNIISAVPFVPRHHDKWIHNLPRMPQY